MSQDFLNVLSALMSTDNQVRRAAEDFFTNQLETNLEVSLDYLLQIFSTPTFDLVIRSFSGVLLRRAIEKYSQKLSADVTNNFRLRLMNLWAVETNRNLMQRLSHMMAQSALKSPWNDLLPQVIEYSSKLEGVTVIPVLSLIEIVSDYCPSDILAHLPLLGSFLGKYLSSSELSIQVACAKATCACIMALDDDTARNSFKPALEPIVTVLGTALSHGDESNATSIIENLVQVAQMQPTFFKASIDMVVNAMLSVAGSVDTLEFSTRSMALELMVTLTECAPAIARRCQGLAQGLIPLAMKMSLEVEEEDADWAKGKYTEEPSEDENCTVGDEAVERVATGMGGRVVSVPVLGIVQQYSANAKWEYRRAAVAGLCRLAEGSTKTFKGYLKDALPFLSAALQDKSARVKFEGIQTIGRFASLFTESVGDMVDRFLPSLTMLLQDSNTCDRVRGHAAAALIDLLNPEHCEAETLNKFLDPLLNSLVYCLQSAPLEVQAPCLVLLGCIAQVAGEGFAPYYNSFMPGIKSVMVAATAPDQAALRGKAMGCASLVGDAVGVDVFANDAMEIMQLLIQAIHQDTDRDVTFEYILPACVRISKALGTHFEPFLPVVMEPLLVGATQVTQFSIVDAEEDDIEGEVTHDDETGTESTVVSLGAGVRKRVTLNTHAVQQKNQAARIIFEFAVSMRGHLKQFIHPLLQAILALAADKHSSDIRSSASLALSKTFEAYVHAIQKGFISSTPAERDEVILGCLSKILDCIRNENDGTARACSTEAFRDILLACFNSGEENVDGFKGNMIVKPSLQLSQGIMKEVLAQCAESMLRRKDKEQSIANNAGYDAEDREAAAEQLEEEEELLTSLADALGQLLKIHGSDFMPTFDTVIAPAFSTYLSPEHPAALQIIAVCLVDDAVEFGGTPAHKYIPTLLSSLIRNLRSDDHILRQCSMYGMARATYAAAEAVKAQLSSVIPSLIGVISDPSAGEEDNVGTVENAIFAVGTLVSDLTYRDAFAASGVTVESLATLWLQRMPLTADEKEGKTASRQLCDCIERNDAAVLGGANFSNMKEILRVIAEVLQSVQEHQQAQSSRPQHIMVDEDAPVALAHPHTVERLRGILKQFSSGGAVSPQVLMEGYRQLSPELQAVLKNHSS